MKKETLAIDCSCRLPDDGAEMVECHECGEWFHFSCFLIKRDTLNNDEDWKCSSCQVALPDVYAHIPNLPSNNCLSPTLYSSPLSLLFYNYTIASLSLIIIVLIIIHVHACIFMHCKNNKCLSKLIFNDSFS